VTNGNGNFQGGSQNVDRTASTQPLGGVHGNQGGGKRKRSFVSAFGEADPTCQMFNSLRIDEFMSELDGCSSGFIPQTSGLTFAMQKCKSDVLLTWLAVVCPPYGVPFSGFAQSLVDQVELKCSTAGCAPQWPWLYFPGGDQLVVVDGTAYSITSVQQLGIVADSGEFEFDNNYHYLLAPGSDRVQPLAPSLQSGYLEVSVVEFGPLSIPHGQIGNMSSDTLLNILTSPSQQVFTGVYLLNQTGFGVNTNCYGIPTVEALPIDGVIVGGIAVQVRGQIYIDPAFLVIGGDCFPCPPPYVNIRYNVGIDYGYVDDSIIVFNGGVWDGINDLGSSSSGTVQANALPGWAPFTFLTWTSNITSQVSIQLTIQSQSAGYNPIGVVPPGGVGPGIQAWTVADQILAPICVSSGP